MTNKEKESIIEEGWLMVRKARIMVAHGQDTAKEINNIAQFLTESVK